MRNIDLFISMYIYIGFFNVILELFVFLEVVVVIRRIILIMIRGIVIDVIMSFIEGWCWFKVGLFVLFLVGILKKSVVLNIVKIILIRNIVKMW